LAPLKVFTAFRANQLLARRGYYERLIRSQAEFERVHDYNEQNPVTAGLIAEVGQYPCPARRAA
jgi:hypothetical protein